MATSAVSKPLDISALAEHRRILTLWRIAIIAGVFIFVGLLVLSYFILNSQSITHDAVRYKRAESALGFSELAGLALSALALLRFINLRAKSRERVFSKFIADNNWSANRKYKLDEVASILLGAGESYEEGYCYSGKHGGRPFNCLVFQYIAANSRTRRFICLSYSLSKAYPMIVIDNRLNDHGFRRQTSDLPDRVPDGVDLTLEGGFNKYFRVGAAKGREREALEVLSPDFMEILLDQANNKVDIEISDKNLFLIYEADFYTERNASALFSTAGAVLGKLDKLSKTWLASSRGEEKVVGDAALEARHKLIFESDYMTLAVALLVLLVGIFLMISAISQPGSRNSVSPVYIRGQQSDGARSVTKTPVQQPG